MKGLNKQQTTLLLLLLKNGAMIGTFYFGYWIFIYCAVYHPLWFCIMLNAVNMVLCVLCFVGWIVLESWLRFPDTIPTFRLERGNSKSKSKSKSKMKQKTKDKPKPKDKKLPLF